MKVTNTFDDRTDICNTCQIVQFVFAKANDVCINYRLKTTGKGQYICVKV